MEPVHPATGKPLTDFERWLWRLRMVAHEAQVMWRGFNGTEDVARDINEDLMFGITNHALLIVTRFLEIWDDMNRFAKLDSRVIPTRKAITPIIDRINIWTGLRTFRNSTLAHSYLTRDNKLLPPWELSETEKAPTYHAEVILLLQLVVFAALAVLCVFEAEYTPLDPLMGPDDQTPGPGPGISKGTEIDPALRKLLPQVDIALKIELGVQVRGPIAKAFKEAIKP